MLDVIMYPKYSLHFNFMRERKETLLLIVFGTSGHSSFTSIIQEVVLFIVYKA